MDILQMTPRRPYLLRAFYEWLLDNELTPYLVVNIKVPGVHIPLEYARNGQIVLNIAPRAVGHLKLSNDEVRFNARFGGGIPRQVLVPLEAILAIYARENGAGTIFEPEAAYAAYDKEKNNPSADGGASSKRDRTMSLVINSDDKPDDDPNDDTLPRNGRPVLRIVE